MNQRLHKLRPNRLSLVNKKSQGQLDILDAPFTNRDQQSLRCIRRKDLPGRRGVGAEVDA